MNKSYEKLVSINENKFSIVTGGRNIMLTLGSRYTGHSAIVDLSFHDPNKSKLGLILGLTLGMSAFICIIIIIGCCCKKAR